MSLDTLQGVGPGHGSGLMFVLAGMLVILVSLGAYPHRPLRRVERELPDAVESCAEPEGVPAIAVEAPA